MPRKGKGGSMKYKNITTTLLTLLLITTGACVKDKTQDMDRKKDIETYSITEKNAELSTTMPPLAYEDNSRYDIYRYI